MTVEFEDGVLEPSLAVAVQEGNMVSSCQLQECLDISGVLVCIREQWKLCGCVWVCVGVCGYAWVCGCVCVGWEGGKVIRH